MAVEQDSSIQPKRPAHLSLVALFEREEEANELLERLESLFVDTSEATIVRVDNSVPPYVRKGTAAQPGLSPVKRYGLTGAIIGSAICLLPGILLYEIGIFSLPFSQGLLPHAVLAASVGALLGGLVGVLSGSATAQVARPQIAEPVSEQTTPETSRDGFLVVVKIPMRLAERSETIARQLGAKEIIL